MTAVVNYYFLVCEGVEILYLWCFVNFYVPQQYFVLEIPYLKLLEGEHYHEMGVQAALNSSVGRHNSAASDSEQGFG